MGQLLMNQINKIIARSKTAGSLQARVKDDGENNECVDLCSQN